MDISSVIINCDSLQVEAQRYIWNLYKLYFLHADTRSSQIFKDFMFNIWIGSYKTIFSLFLFRTMLQISLKQYPSWKISMTLKIDLYQLYIIFLKKKKKERNNNNFNKTLYLVEIKIVFFVVSCSHWSVLICKHIEYVFSFWRVYNFLKFKLFSLICL